MRFSEEQKSRFKGQIMMLFDTSTELGSNVPISAAVVRKNLGLSLAVRQVGALLDELVKAGKLARGSVPHRQHPGGPGITVYSKREGAS